MQITGNKPDECALSIPSAPLPQRNSSTGAEGTLQGTKPVFNKYWRLFGWSIVAAASFHLATLSDFTSALAVVYLFCLVKLLAAAGTWRQAFYPGLVVGIGIAAAHLTFFTEIFSFGAAALWLVFALWVGLFTLIGWLCVTRLPASIGFAVLPCVWTGLEYFRSELYYLRFSWLSPGYLLAQGATQALLSDLGVFGLGFVAAVLGSMAAFAQHRPRWSSMAILAVSVGSLSLSRLFPAGAGANETKPVLKVAGVQLEFPSQREVLIQLDELAREHPDTHLFVLPEYAFQEPVPARVLDWCRKAGKYLIVGGREPAGTNQFYNTAYVVSPAGEVVFRQAKAVPIQFFKDGLPAPEQKIWNSPWGRIGICICYDLSYTRVTDELVKQGAQVLIVPTMDVADWGKRQHLLHARVAPVRAAEYRLPVFRVASSGISQAVNSEGEVVASAPFPGAGAFIAARLNLPRCGSLPLDRRLAQVCLGVTGVMLVWSFARPSRAFWRPSAVFDGLAMAKRGDQGVL